VTTTAQQRLIDAVLRTLQGDERVASLWLSGSLGKDQADAFSDVDFVVAVADTTGFELVNEYARDLSAIADVVHARALFGRIVTAMTRDLDRFDLFFVSEAELASVDAAAVKCLFARGAARPAGSAAARAEPSKLEANIGEFLRVLALAPVVIGRGEYLLGVDGAMLLRRMAIETMLEENGVTSAMRGGVLKLNRFLTAEQRAALDTLPPLAATRASVIEAHGALARIFLSRARTLAAARGVTWPESFEQAVRSALARELDLAI
jgi:predicted nucleotidyltransferase